MTEKQAPECEDTGSWDFDVGNRTEQEVERKESEMNPMEKQESHLAEVSPGTTGLCDGELSDSFLLPGLTCFYLL